MPLTIDKDNQNTINDERRNTIVIGIRERALFRPEHNLLWNDDENT